MMLELALSCSQNDVRRWASKVAWSVRRVKVYRAV
jgi:hypothetical protein